MKLMSLLIAVCLLPALAEAKRAVPGPVEPVAHEGVRYTAPNDDGRRGYIVASDATTNAKLWELTLWTKEINPRIEEDGQWIFIKSLAIKDGKLIVTAERGKVYQVDLKMRAVIPSALSDGN